MPQHLPARIAWHMDGSDRRQGGLSTIVLQGALSVPENFLIGGAALIAVGRAVYACA